MMTAQCGDAFTRPEVSTTSTAPVAVKDVSVASEQMRASERTASSVWRGVRAVLAAMTTWYTYFGVNSANPMNHQNDFSGNRVDIDDELVDKRLNDALLQACVGTRIFP